MDHLGGSFDRGLVGRMGEDENESRSGSDNIEGASGDDQDAAAAAADGRRPKKQENDKLRAENDYLKQAMINSVCNSCGGPTVPGEVSYEQHQLKIENARLKEELSRVCALTNKFLGWPPSSSVGPIASQGLSSNLELAVGRNGFGGLNNAGTSLPMDFNFRDGAMLPLMTSRSNEMPYNRSAIVDVALMALDELLKLVQLDNPLWIKGLDGGIETLNLEEYNRTFPSCIGMKPSGYTTEATRATGLVSLDGLALVEALTDADRWAEMFPSLISSAATIDVLSTGTGIARDNTLLVMDAEFRALSPLVPARRVRFIRFCKQHSEGVWAVVDVSINTTQDATNTHTFPNCRRLPSGCVIQDLDNNSGSGFGAHRWIGTLQRQSHCLALLISPDIPGENNIGITPAGRKNMLKLAQRMTNNFCAGVSASSVQKWEKPDFGTVGEDMMVMTRKNVNDPGEPLGVLLSAATSVWIPATQKKLFDFLRDERMRIQWDILSNGGPMQEMINVAKGTGHGNSVSLLRGGAISANESTMLILQETWSDASGAMVIYAPIDLSSMSIVMNGGDSAYVALLPSGFAILPNGSPSYHGGQSNSNGQMANPDNNGTISSNGCILTVGFQILVNSVPTSKLTLESVETVSHLISCTIQKIKDALMAT
ncbi:hypothetical protein V6N11_027957 [Hibiscus sabdariffa]|uniref:START domain-containing protein n=1 Tax=Hibiscus sabdariffa TaxID=183260 RepID=A0ABR2NZJ5_9ROSI